MTTQTKRLFSGSDKCVDDLYAAEGCCLEETLGEPIRRRIKIEDWQTAGDGNHLGCELQLLQLQVRKRFKLTNMHMERRLREEKSALPAMRAKANAESFAYAGLLTQVWKSHIDLQYSNPLREDRESLQGQSLPVAPLARPTTRESSRLRLRRMDQSWVMEQYHIWRKSTSSSCPNLRSEKLLELRQTWAAMPLDERPCVRDSIPDSGLPPMPDVCHPCDSEFYSGDGTWPVGVQRLIDYCGKPSGLAHTATKARWENRGKLVTLGTQNLIPLSQTFHRRYSCWQRHPGLCWTRDTLIYQDFLRTINVFKENPIHLKVSTTQKVFLFKSIFLVGVF